MEKVFAVVVTYNGLQWLDRCLGSLLSSDMPVTVVVVDNASTDGTPEHILADYPDVRLIRSNVNHGFAKANNIGIRYALDNRADYVFLLNQDAWTVEEHTIRSLIGTFERNASVGIVSPIHMNGQNDSLDWKFATYMSGDFVSDAYLGRIKEEYLTDYVNAAAWLVSRECFEKIGGFDTNLFVHYGEDSAYLQRVKYWKRTVWVNTKVHVCHDREFRKQNDDAYQQSVFKRDQELHDMKKKYGDINYNIDIDAKIRANRYRIFKKTIKLQFAEVRRLRQVDDVLLKIKFSREINKDGHMAWL